MNGVEPTSQMDKQHGERAGNLTEIAAIAHALDSLYLKLGRQFGPLSRPQRRMLRLLSAERTVRVGDLGEQLGLTTAGATRMLDKLESLGYATRLRLEQHDQRQVHVMLAPAGVSALREADGVFLERMRAILDKLGPEEQSTLARLLQALGDC
ncbi:MAG: MarR family transcriptional regulator [Chloroflexi bacterium]|nr:MarR family transcriptional regulator [Chloroflexota bacterium]